MDVLLVNRIRRCTTTYDHWGKPKHHYSETWYLSFWSWLPLYPPPMGVWIARGWWSLSQLRNVTPATGGWAVENDAGLVVFGGELWVVDSPFDWEVRNRLLFSPIR